MPEKNTTKGDLPPEVDRYLAALVKDPKSKAFVPLADTYRKAGMLDEAIQVAKDGLKHNPNYVSGRLVLGRCYFDKDMLKEAEDEISRVVKANPENADAQRILAKIREKTGRLDEAIKIWDIVATLVPNDTEAKQKIGELKSILSVERKEEPAPSEQTEEKKEAGAKVEEKREEIKEERGEKVQTITEGREEKPESTQEVREEKDEIEKEEISISQTEEQKPKEEEILSPEPERESARPEEDRIPSAKTASAEEGSAGTACEIPSAPEQKRREEVISEPEKPIEEQQTTLSQIKVHKEERDDKEKKVHEATMREESIREISEPKESKQKEIIAKEDGKGISTRALAELYVKQGFLERALKVYKELEASSPDDKEIKAQINFINMELSKKANKEPKEIKFKDNIKTLSSWLDKIKRGG
jgi:tetratricopeptide (TPR) repeat protein